MPDGSSRRCVPVARPSCQHLFHRVCLEEAVKVRPHCPICRREVSLSQIEYLKTAVVRQASSNS